MTMLAYNQNLNSSLSMYQEKLFHLQKEILAIENLKGSQSWNLFTVKQKERLNEQLHSLRRVLIVHSTPSH